MKKELWEKLVPIINTVPRDRPVTCIVSAYTTPISISYATDLVASCLYFSNRYQYPYHSIVSVTIGDKSYSDSQDHGLIRRDCPSMAGVECPDSCPRDGVKCEEWGKLMRPFHAPQPSNSFAQEKDCGECPTQEKESISIRLLSIDGHTMSLEDVERITIEYRDGNLARWTSDPPPKTYTLSILKGIPL